MAKKSTRKSNETKVAKEKTTKVVKEKVAKGSKSVVVKAEKPAKAKLVKAEKPIKAEKPVKPAKVEKPAKVKIRKPEKAKPSARSCELRVNEGEKLEVVLSSRHGDIILNELKAKTLYRSLGKVFKGRKPYKAFIVYATDTEPYVNVSKGQTAPMVVFAQASNDARVFVKRSVAYEGISLFGLRALRAPEYDSYYQDSYGLNLAIWKNGGQLNGIDGKVLDKLPAYESSKEKSLEKALKKIKAEVLVVQGI